MVQESNKQWLILPNPDLGEFRAWFAPNSIAGAWDREFEEDAQSGTLDRLADQIPRGYGSGGDARIMSQQSQPRERRVRSP